MFLPIGTPVLVTIPTSNPAWSTPTVDVPGLVTGLDMVRLAGEVSSRALPTRSGTDDVTRFRSPVVRCEGPLPFTVINHRGNWEYS